MRPPCLIIRESSNNSINDESITPSSKDHLPAAFNAFSMSGTLEVRQHHSRRLANVSERPDNEETVGEKPKLKKRIQFAELLDNQSHDVQRMRSAQERRKPLGTVGTVRSSRASCGHRKAPVHCVCNALGLEPPTRFELVTLCLQDRCSGQLS